MVGEALEQEQRLALIVNGDAREVPAPCTLQNLLGLLELERKRVAIAVNRDVVPRSAFPERQLEEGDRVEILEAVGGGC